MNVIEIDDYIIVEYQLQNFNERDR